MSGHSKWSQIKRQKGVADVKRGLTFTKLSNAITIAVKQGEGIGDPDQNFRLRLSIDAAKVANMPKDNIERAIKRALGKEAGQLEEVVYEGFYPGGVTLIVEAATDNSQRTTSFIKSLFNKSGASFGQPGSVSYQFNQSGEIVIKKNNMSFDDIFAAAVEFGAEDVEEVLDEVLVFTSVSELAKIRELLEKKGFEIIYSDIIRKPITPLTIKDEEELGKIERFISAIEELDDVQKVYSNIA
ncbi:MAG TPA: YebC/PmpR family DNA-binding transcriptional regulator [Patescibacteria group bacterium]|nr:YebC/PmpR family DNA-binding transcriptional regulator [Patescibacteria group bacterium]